MQPDWNPAVPQPGARLLPSTSAQHRRNTYWLLALTMIDHRRNGRREFSIRH
jgi:hypothetical protein